MDALQSGVGRALAVLGGGNALALVVVRSDPTMGDEAGGKLMTL